MDICNINTCYFSFNRIDKPLPFLDINIVVYIICVDDDIILFYFGVT